MTRRIAPLFVLAFVLAPGARAADIAIGGQAGTLGLGASVTVGLTETLNVRGLVNDFSYDFSDEASDFDYEFDLDLSGYGALLDWHVFGSGFRVSAGAFFNDNQVAGVGRPLPGTTVEIGDLLVPAEFVDRAEADVAFDDFAPYVGLGWGNAVGRDKRLGISLDLGVLLQGAPEPNFRAFASDLAPPGFDDIIAQEVEREQAEIREDLEEFEFYPVLSLGLSYKF